MGEGLEYLREGLEYLGEGLEYLRAVLEHLGVRVPRRGVGAQWREGSSEMSKTASGGVPVEQGE